MKINLKKEIFFIVTFLIVLGALKLMDTNLFNINEISYSTDNKAVYEDILKNIESYKGKSIFTVNTAILEQSILKDVRIKSVNIKKNYPDKLIVDIEPRKAYGYIRQGSKYYLLDENLNIFGKFGENQNMNIPVVQYENNDKINISKILQELSKSKFYNISSELMKKDNYYRIILTSGVNLYVNESITTKKLNQAFKVYQKEMEVNDLEYMDLRFETINVK